MSPNGLAVLKYFETCKLDAYPDPASKDGSPWTIGWGHTGPEVHRGLKWTQEKADAVLLLDLKARELAVCQMVSSAISQGMFDALVDMAYNVGEDALRHSTLLRLVNAGDMAGAAAQFLRWDKAGGRPMRGLTRRCKAREQLALGHDGQWAIQAGLAAA